jgi:hypothetical protein
MSVANVLGIAILSQIFLSIEEKSLPRDTLFVECLGQSLPRDTLFVERFGHSYSYLTKSIGKFGRNGYSAVDLS